ncbi:hypothetical protein ACXVUM_06620 [Williamsia sp. SKLECPSW1]
MQEAEVNALAVNVAVPEALRWTAERRGEQFTLTTITVRLLPDGGLASKAYGRPAAGGRGGYTAFPVPDDPRLDELIAAGADEAARRWSAHRGRS